MYIRSQFYRSDKIVNIKYTNYREYNIIIQNEI